MPDTVKSPSTNDTLVLDATSREDLLLFNDDPDAPSLFNFCNYCDTEGGEAVLRQRMRAPSCDVDQIRATQQAIRFILEQRKIFATLPSGYLSGNVDQYSREPIPVVTQTSRLEFGAAAFSIWANEDRFYIRITKGVGLACRFVRALRNFFHELSDVSQTVGGEAAPLIKEIGELLSHEAFDQIADEETARRFWTTLRLDQVFRMHAKAALTRLLDIVYELDALVSLAVATDKHNLHLPCVESGPTQLFAKDLVHPFVPNAVANPAELHQQKRLLFLTGPNMAGKTTYLRAIATGLYFAHLGMGVPASEFRFTPAEQLLTSISLNDDIHDGISYFRAEALRVKAVAQAVAAGDRVVAIMDEPFKGTNVRDAFDASLAILQRLADKPQCLFIVSSHLIELSDQLGDHPHISYHYFEAQEQANRLQFDYALHDGVSSQRLGMRVLEEEGIFNLLDSGD